MPRFLACATWRTGRRFCETHHKMKSGIADFALNILNLSHQCIAKWNCPSYLSIHFLKEITFCASIYLTGLLFLLLLFSHSAIEQNKQYKTHKRGLKEIPPISHENYQNESTNTFIFMLPDIKSTLLILFLKLCY